MWRYQGIKVGCQRKTSSGKQQLSIAKKSKRCSESFSKLAQIVNRVCREPDCLIEYSSSSCVDMNPLVLLDAVQDKSSGDE